ncbi:MULTISPECIES: T9SS type B sorting domain-containing protein [Niastella]|uniref:Gliding motility-associated C-terminal domain-containing protein n=1 Tax=Niastella soli TaxID=2821487 RepID=A0ABS3Z055_9BACT|nr:gliding motility-associated C-terminal domain-containing protein [Niastella soli]MBO9203469.1 gliding motility-associated C-terminal domain-containing protein [Niastella soli]
MRLIGLFAVLLLWNSLCRAQDCTTLGQTPSTAFPVCGLTTLEQDIVPPCRTHDIKVPGCDDLAPYGDKNPFWYRFNCYKTGTLGLLITPNDLVDDYDWMLFDITGRNADEVFTNPSLVVTGNWSGSAGLTGASNSGVNYIQCSSDPANYKNTFSTMPTIQEGHTYLLLISHFTDESQSGYKLSFGGGSGSITDPLKPNVKGAWASCGGVSVTLIMNKKMKCSSLAADGSDFRLTPRRAQIVSATAVGCSNSFDFDTVVLTLNKALTATPTNDYRITIQTGSDGNTLLDNCDQMITDGNHINFIVDPGQPTPMGSINSVACAPDKVELVFRRPIKCNSIAVDGSDFTLVGSTPVTITGATGGKCVNGVSTSVFVNLSAPITSAGNYRITLKTGTDGNTVIDDCDQETPPGGYDDFSTADTVNADFTYQTHLGCVTDVVNFFHDGANSVNKWNWNFNNQGKSTEQNPTYSWTVFGPKEIQLIVSNGVCTDTSQSTVLLDNFLEADFGLQEVLCPEDKAIFTDSSVGKIISWNWDFGNGNTSLLQNPLPEAYPLVNSGRSRLFPVRLIVENDLHCTDTAVKQMKVVYSCLITVPNGFTPNGDGHNDYLYPLNAWKAINMEFIIYNRYGQIVFRSNNWTNKWDGRLNGQLQPSGVFVWLLRYTLIDTGEKVFKRGTTVLIR